MIITLAKKYWHKESAFQIRALEFFKKGFLKRIFELVIQYNSNWDMTGFTDTISK